jgi:hypothetical protein
MTMPIERTRALRWMWEFLVELKNESNLPLQAVSQIESILEHFPTPAQIQDLARQDSANPKSLFGPDLEPEVDLPSSEGLELTHVHNGASTHEQRINAMKSAHDFVRITLSELGCLTDQQKRTKAAVLRHYPRPSTPSSLPPLV